MSDRETLEHRLLNAQIDTERARQQAANAEYDYWRSQAQSRVSDTLNEGMKIGKWYPLNAMVPDGVRCLIHNEAMILNPSDPLPGASWLCRSCAQKIAVPVVDESKCDCPTKDSGWSGSRFNGEPAHSKTCAGWTHS